MNIIVHIGSERTGSTSIQRFLYENHGTLRSLSYEYITTGTKNAKILALAFSTNPARDFMSEMGCSDVKKIHDMIKDVKLQLITKIEAAEKRGCHNIIISSEHFASRVSTLSDILKFKHFLSEKCSNIRIIGFSREENSFIESLYSVALLSGHAMTFDEFKEAVKLDEKYFPLEEIWHRWRKAFPLAVTVLDYDKLNPSDLIPTFLQEIGLDISLFKYFEKSENRSLSETQKLILLKLNKIRPNYVGWNQPVHPSITFNIIRSLLKRVFSLSKKANKH